MFEIGPVVSELHRFADDFAARVPLRAAAINEASRRSREADWQSAATRISVARTSWLVADWFESPACAAPLPIISPPFTVFAVDGSQIAASRHDTVFCHLVNTGLVVLRYGDGRRPTLSSSAHIIPAEDGDGTGEDTGDGIPSTVSIRRTLAEYEALAAAIRLESPCSAKSVALFDGSLIAWPLTNEEPDRRAVAIGALCGCLDAARERGIPIAGYVSRPRSRDVVNSLRASVCPHPEVNCDRYCPGRAASPPVHPPCSGVGEVTDAMLFAACLQPGERSAVFGSRSQILSQYPRENRIRFFYLNTGWEIARIELPAWTAEDTEKLDVVHALAYDQAVKGGGYPVALAEAHEQAIVRGADRESFFAFLEREMLRRGMRTAGTRKAASKLARRI